MKPCPPPNNSLSPGVGNEAFLLFVALRNRTDDAPGEEQQKQEDRDRPCQGDADARIEKATEGLQLPCAVEKEQQRFALTVCAAAAVFAGEAPCLPGSVNFLRKGLRLLLAQRGEVVQIQAQKIAVSSPENQAEKKRDW